MGCQMTSFHHFALLAISPLCLPVFAHAQVADRVAAVSSSAMVQVRATASPHAIAAHDAGEMDPGRTLDGITIQFKPSASQKEALDALVQAQQTPGSAQYHRWITPATYAANFGLSANDLARVQNWLEQQGFTVERIAANGSAITFSGSVAQVEAAFSTQMHNYAVDGETHFANATAISLPSAFAGVVSGVGNLDSFRPHARVRVHKNSAATPLFTSSQTGNHFLTPADVATIYDINAAYSAGDTGSGQSLAILGQSAIATSDLEAFQTAAGLAIKDPTLILVPNSGTSTTTSGDEAESDLDLEYSSAIARGATIHFVYTGNNANYNVFDSLQYAVTTDVAPIISMSYGSCETALSQSSYDSLNAVLEEAASQGQSVISASGDSGSTDCYEDKSLTQTQRMGIAVDFPASSQYVTGLGGSEFPSADIASTNTTYWEAAPAADAISTALSYIPEQAWNDDSAANGISSGGGGVSTLTPRPTWQTGVPGIASGGFRMVPDISLDASPDNAGYLYCTSDSSSWSKGQTSSCTSGFRDSSSQQLNIAGGTSFAAPIFAGMLAIINGKLNSTGQGVVAPTLYSLASSSATYASAFHDITLGGNQCLTQNADCTAAGAAQYAAGTGYDEATGLGSVDLYNLLNAWSAAATTTGASTTLQPTTTALAPATATPASGASDVVTITVAAQSSASTTTPTGTVSLAVDGTVQSTPLTLANGSATYTFSSATAGSHVIKAMYSGDGTYAASSASTTLTVAAPTTPTTGTFSITATNVTVAQGATGTSTITVSPTGYTGTVNWQIASNQSLANGCYSIASTAITGTAAVTQALTLYTASSQCTTASVTTGTGRRLFVSASTQQVASNAHWTAMLAGGFLFCGLLGFRTRRLRGYAATAALLLVAAGGIGCGGTSGTRVSTASSTSSDVAQGTYMLTVTGTDSNNKALNASATLTLVVN